MAKSRGIKHDSEVLKPKDNFITAPSTGSIKTIGTITGRVKEISGPSLKIENEGPDGAPYRAKGKDQSS